MNEPAATLADAPGGAPGSVRSRAPSSREGFGEPPDPSRERVLQALRDNDWNYVKTAAALGISVDKLYRLRFKYGIERPK